MVLTQATDLIALTAPTVVTEVTVVMVLTQATDLTALTLHTGHIVAMART